jgi:hypothetical protein
MTTADEFFRMLDRVSLEFPLHTLVSLLTECPHLISFKSLLAAGLRISPNTPQHVLAKYAELLASSQEPFLQGRLSILHCTKIVQSLQASSVSLFATFIQLINSELETLRDISLKYESSVNLALILRRRDLLTPQVAQRIVGSLLQLDKGKRSNLLEIASSAYDLLDEQRLRIMLVVPILNTLNFAEAVSCLGAVLAWPHNESHHEVRFGELILEHLKKQRSFPWINELLSQLRYSQAHIELVKKIETGVVEVSAKLLRTTDNQGLLSLTQAFKVSKSSNSRLIELIAEAYHRRSAQLTVKEKIEIHSALLYKGIKVPSISKNIATELTSNFSPYVGLSHAFVYELAEANLAKEAWAVKVIQLAAQNKSQFKLNDAVTHLAFALILSGAPREQVEECALSSEPEEYKGLLKQLVIDYVRLNNITSLATIQQPDFKQFDPLLNIFGISEGPISSLCRALELSKLEAQPNACIEGIQVPVYLPGLRTSIWPLTFKSFLNNSDEVRGSHQLYLDLVEARGVRVVQLRSQLIDGQKPEETLQVLTAAGLSL